MSVCMWQECEGGEGCVWNELTHSLTVSERMNERHIHTDHHTRFWIISYRICKTNGQRPSEGERDPLKKVQINGSHHRHHHHYHFQCHFLELSIEHFLCFISSHSLAVTILWNCNVNHLSPNIYMRIPYPSTNIPTSTQTENKSHTL